MLTYVRVGHQINLKLLGWLFEASGCYFKNVCMIRSTCRYITVSRWGCSLIYGPVTFERSTRLAHTYLVGLSCIDKIAKSMNLLNWRGRLTGVVSRKNSIVPTTRDLSIKKNTIKSIKSEITKCSCRKISSRLFYSSFIRIELKS
jgi:hypothetical protein